MLQRIALAGVVLAFAVSCATNEKERVVPGAVFLPSSMCAKKGVAAASNDAPGHRMICEREEVVGSHYPRCVCRDEADMVATRQAAQQNMLDMEQTKCSSNGGGTCH